MSKALKWLPWAIVVIVIFLFWQSQKLGTSKLTPQSVTSSDVTQTQDKASVKHDVPPMMTSYREAVNIAAPAVVNIFTTQKIKNQNRVLSNENGIRDFFRNQIPELKNKNENNLGSGVIMREDGYILTNNHVITQADQIIVALKDGRRAVASVVGIDPDTDLAVIKIDLTQLPIMSFKTEGNDVGDVVLAIGNPFGVGQTVTQGIISALGRSDLGINTYEDFIQTDAAINPGNSGGALVDVKGQLIGLNTAIFSQSGGSLGIGFAIPAKVCQHVFDSILKQGKVIRGWLGLSLVPTQYSGDVVGNKEEGIEVASVSASGPSAQAGVRQGDHILRVNGVEITSASHLINYVALQAPGTTVKLELLRNMQPLTLMVIVGERQKKRSQSEYIPLPNR
ncbi:trypsin-like peptidase domain-containing protein [Acinetobacter sp. B10A]|uniref:S1C family serine protease n=1 Tax=Acinetobacter baretiae TaxID=2605383 RepID=UPI001B3C8273|nr:trypsin-like peptidase domain-containing protein [Acinetobacter baretiae]MBF7684240.1 trypsin-like peptidase domain-containing protein [Acinetobacter baretiae]